MNREKDKETKLAMKFFKRKAKVEKRVVEYDNILLEEI